MLRESASRTAGGLDPRDLLQSADFFKREGEDVSEELRAFERQVMESLSVSGGTGRFETSIQQTLLPEVGAEIFDTLLSDYLKWYRSRVIAVTMPTEQDRLSFTGYAQIERPWPVGLGIAYEMVDAGMDEARPEPGARRKSSAQSRPKVHKIRLVPGSVRVGIDASIPVRAAIAALKVEATIHDMLGNPADIVRKTLECRLRAAYDYCQPLADVSLSIKDGVVAVAFYAAPPA